MRKDSGKYIEERDAMASLQERMREWVQTRIGWEHMHPAERAMRLLEEAVELAQAEGIPHGQVCALVEHVYRRPSGVPRKEMGGVLACALAWCASTGYNLLDLAMEEVERIEAKPVSEIRASVARKEDDDLLRVGPAVMSEKITREDCQLVDEFKRASHPLIEGRCGFFPGPSWTREDWERETLCAAKRWKELGKPTIMESGFQNEEG